MLAWSMKLLQFLDQVILLDVSHSFIVFLILEKRKYFNFFFTASSYMLLCFKHLILQLKYMLVHMLHYCIWPCIWWICNQKFFLLIVWPKNVKQWKMCLRSKNPSKARGNLHISNNFFCKLELFSETKIF